MVQINHMHSAHKGYQHAWDCSFRARSMARLLSLSPDAKCTISSCGEEQAADQDAPVTTTNSQYRRCYDAVEQHKLRAVLMAFAAHIPCQNYKYICESNALNTNCLKRKVLHVFVLWFKGLEGETEKTAIKCLQRVVLISMTDNNSCASIDSIQRISYNLPYPGVEHPKERVLTVSSSCKCSWRSWNPDLRWNSDLNYDGHRFPSTASNCAWSCWETLN